MIPDFQNRRWLAVPALLLLLFLGGCAYDPYATGADHMVQRYRHFEHYEPTLVQIARMRATHERTVGEAGIVGQELLPAGDKGASVLPAAKAGKLQDDPYIDYRISDIDVLNYADHIAAIFQSKFTGARLARYTAATAQSALAALAGITSMASAGPAAPPALAFASAFTPDLGKIFNAKGRAIAYQQALANIQDAEIVYLKTLIHEQGTEAEIPSAQLTPGALELYDTVCGNIKVVEKFMADGLPSLDDMKQAAGEETEKEKAASKKSSK